LSCFIGYTDTVFVLVQYQNRSLNNQCLVQDIFANK